jgi:hypothetical protein
MIFNLNGVGQKNDFSSLIQIGIVSDSNLSQTLGGQCFSYQIFSVTTQALLS